MHTRRARFTVLVLIAFLLGCSGGSRGARPSPGGPRPSHGGAALAVLTTVETGHQGMGSSQYRVQVDPTGQVFRQSDGSPPTPCRGLDPGRLAALRDSIRRAFAAGLQDIYNTSTRPGPNANYSRSKTLELAVDGQQRRVQIDGWADVPPQVSQILSQLSEATQGC